MSIYQCFLAKFVLRMCKNCYFRAFGQNSDTAVELASPIWYRYFGDRWAFTMWHWPFTLWQYFWAKLWKNAM